MTRVLIFDSGPLINFSMNGLIDILESLSKKTKVQFVTTQAVKREVYDNPLRIQQFELGALRIHNLLQKKAINFPENLSINIKQLEAQTRDLLANINRAFRAEGESIQLVSEAEVSCMALALMLKAKGHEPLIAIDERTGRLLCEKPESLQRLMEQKLHKPVNMDKRNIESLRTLKCIRSSELVYVAYKKGLINLNDNQALEALLYATKFKGTAISWDEINILKKL